MLLRMSSTVYDGAFERSSSELIFRGSKPAASHRSAKNGTRAAVIARSRSRVSCVCSITSGVLSHAVSKYSGAGGNAAINAG